MEWARSLLCRTKGHCALAAKEAGHNFSENQSNQKLAHPTRISIG